MSPLKAIDPDRPASQKPSSWMGAKPFLTAEWRWLVTLNYEVEAAMLAPYIPRGLELDTWQGRTYVSLIGFMFLNTRVRDFRVPFHRNFEEVNLRFYVRHGDHRGVVFIREVVPRRTVAWIANAVYGENYVRLPMRHTIESARVEYSWRFGGEWNCITALGLGPRVALAPGSHEEFIAEHYWGYARRSSDATEEYRVEHPPWRVQVPAVARFEGSIAGLYPREFAFVDERPPDTAFVADGSIVAVFRSQRL
ncbi:MAG: YqjF family protein [Terracidiphilus sp.]